MIGALLLTAVLISGATPEECNRGCEWRVAAQLLERSDTRAAIDCLKRCRERFPDDRKLVLLLARSYLLEDNLFWAERTLRDAVAAWPDDVVFREWLAAVHLRQGDPGLVLDDLPPDLEPAEDPQRARWELLGASRARLLGQQSETENLMAGVDRRRTLYPEDRLLWEFLHATTDPWWSQSITGSLELGLGRTSNALAGSPTDPGTTGEPSGLGLVDLRGSLVPSFGSSVRPAIDLVVHGYGLENEAYRDLSTLLGALRVGAVVLKDRHRLAFGYRAEVLLLNQDPARYSEAHRAELEIESTTGTVFFGGGGRRIYRDEMRTRWELDLGLGGLLGRIKEVPVLAGGTLLLADADSAAYDQLGISAVFSARVPLTRSSALQIALNAVFDGYPNSGGDEGRLVFGTEEKRRDLLGRATVTLWTRPWKSLQPHFEFRYTQRASTADATPGFDFSYSEWRIAAWLRWTFAAEPWAPKTRQAQDHIPLEWGFERGRGSDGDRILDLLRRDEELRRGSSCQIK